MEENRTATAPACGDILNRYERLLHHEKQFNTHLAEIRKIASAWLLATMGAVAYIIRGAEDGVLSQQDATLVLLVALLGAVGLTVLWVMDRLVYGRLLDATIFLALQMEHGHREELPLIRSTILALSGSMNTYIAAFYYVPVAVLVATGFFFKANLLLALVAGGAVWLVLALASRRSSFSDLARKGGDDELAGYLALLENSEEKTKMTNLLELMKNPWRKK